MNRLRQWRAQAADARLVAAQRLRARRRGHQSVHVIITGTDLPGMHYIVDEIRRLAPSLRLAKDPQSAIELADSDADVICTWHPDDITRSSEILETIGRYRHIIVIAATADPRDSVCATDDRIPQQYVDGFDYRMRFGPQGKKSFTGPGVVPRIEGLGEWLGRDTASIIGAKRKQLHSTPSEVFEQLRDSVASHTSAFADSFSRLAEATIPLPESASWPGKQDTRLRVAQQIELSPELEQYSVEAGYPAAEDLFGDNAPVLPDRRGTIVAFHTPDEVYRAEAERLKGSLDRLGLEYRFFEVEPEKNWARTTLLKPTWVAKAREELSGPLLYIDVDAYVHADPWPYLSLYDGDLAAVVYDNGELNSASIWISDTAGAREMIRRWGERAERRRSEDDGGLAPTGDNGDQGVLREAVLDAEAQGDTSVVFQRFPVNLTYIFDRGEMTYTVGPVLIEQLQASRESTKHEKRLTRRRERLHQLETEAAMTNADSAAIEPEDSPA